jgi:hypothetical protein
VRAKPPGRFSGMGRGVSAALSGWERSPGLLEEVLCQAPALHHSPDIAAIDQALAEGGYDFAW